MELAELFQRGELRDPRVRDVIVSDVRVTADLQIARVYVRLLNDQPSRHQSVVDVLNHAAGFLRRQLGRRLELRRAPELEFFWDETIDRALRMEELLDELRPETSAEAEGSSMADAARAPTADGSEEPEDEA